jgi:RHS repeat-associated protein
MIRVHCSFFFMIVLALTTSVTSAQVQTGAPPFGSFSGGPEVINNANINAHWTFPFIHKAGRGIDFTYNLSYDTSVWYPVTSGSTKTWQGVGNWGWVAQTEATTGTAGASETFGPSCGFQCNSYVDSNFTYTDVFGVTHAFSGTYQYTRTGGQGGCSVGFVQSSFPSVATDGSGYTMQVSGPPICNSWIVISVTSTSGGVVYAPENGIGGSGTKTDRNGNQITVNSSGQFFDTLSSTTPVLTVTGTGTASSPMKFTYTAPSGVSPYYQVNYTNYTVATNFGVSGINEYKSSAAVPLVTSIVLADGSQYSFNYEATPGACTPYTGTTCVTARVTSVTLPTGGTINYAYSGGNNGILPDGSTATLTRTTPDGTWIYAQVKNTGAASTTTITDPLNNDTVVQFQGIYETQRQTYQGSHTSGTLLQTVNTCYNGAASPCTGTAITLPITQETVIPQYGSTGQQCKHVYTYNAYGLMTEQDDYDYSSGTPTTILRKTLVTYASLSNGIVGMPATVKVQDGSGNTKAQTTYCYDEATPSGSTTCGATGSPSASSGTPQHIGVSGSRGNATTLAYLTQGSSTIGKKFTYYDTGMVKTTTDVNGAATTYNYPDATSTCGNAFTTSVTLPITNPQLTLSSGWNCTGAVMTQATDENGQNTTTTYNDAHFWRPASRTDATGVVTNYYYATTSPYNTVESKLSFNNGNSVVDVLTTVDGLGRTHLKQRRQGPTASNYDSVETDYDSLGRVSRVTLPYSGPVGQTCPSGPSCPATTTTYDALSRISQVTDAGGGTTTYSPYSNNDVVVTVGPGPPGENTKRRQLEYDALGRLTSICEITAGTTAWPGGTCSQNSSQTGYWTKYTYDALGDLLTVTQNAQATSANQQTRTYTFDAMKRLTSEKNPETSQVAISHTYDTDTTCTPASSGDLIKRVDAVGNTTCYAHDALHRITGITYPSGAYAPSTPAKTFVYDSATVNGVAMANVKGRLAEAYTGPSSSKSTDLGFSYTARGEVSDVYELTPHSNSSYYHVSQTYWPHGSPSQLSSGISGLPAISYGGIIGSTVGLDGEGRTTQVTATGTGQQNPVTGVTYNVASLPTQVNFGSGDSDVFAYDSNTLRMTQFKFNVGTQSQSLTGLLTWNANATLGQLAITDQFNSADTQTCKYGDPSASPPVVGYDDLSRLVSANCGSAAAQTFSYDPFGNINKSGSPNSFQPTYSVATNRMTALPGNFTPTYDANGNVTNDSNHTYSWDVDGNSITVDSVGLTFDAFDRMVEQNRSGAYTEIVYAPSGGKLALMSGTGGQTLQKAFVALLGRDAAIYTSSGLDHYRHSDWLGSARLTSTSSRTVSSTVAYAPFGETYAPFGTPDSSFTGENPDTVGTDYDFPDREYSTQGRWASPDPAGLAAEHPRNPQSWNRYAYVLGDPLDNMDPTGDDSISDIYDPSVGGTMPSGPTVGGSIGGLNPSLASMFGQGPGTYSYMGYSVFDAVAGAPGTYIHYDIYGNMTWGWSYDLYNAVVSQYGNSITSGWNYVLSDAFGASGYFADYLANLANQRWILANMPGSLLIQMSTAISVNLGPLGQDPGQAIRNGVWITLEQYPQYWWLGPYLIDLFQQQYQLLGPNRPWNP